VPFSVTLAIVRHFAHGSLVLTFGLKLLQRVEPHPTSLPAPLAHTALTTLTVCAEVWGCVLWLTQSCRLPPRATSEVQELESSEPVTQDAGSGATPICPALGMTVYVVSCHTMSCPCHQSYNVMSMSSVM